MYQHKNGITLKKVTQQDLWHLLELKNESWFGTHSIAIINDTDQQKWFDKITADSKNLVMIAWKDAERIGVYKISNIDYINRRYDSAHDVFSNQRGKGYSKPVLEAGVDFGFEILNMHRLDTEVLTGNISMKAALAVGFVEEGVKRKCIHKCNQYIDSTVMGILREDWQELPRVKAYGGVCNLTYAPIGGKS
jgi:diamine N-acetyltransferase